MKKFLSIILVVTMCVCTLTACSNEKTTVTESETTTTQKQTNIDYTQEYYDFFKEHSRAINTIIGVDFDTDKVSDDSLLMFAIEELISQSKKKLDNNEITQDQYDMEIIQFFPNKIDEVTNKFFGCKAKDYNTDSTDFNEESGAVVPSGWSIPGDSRFMLSNREEIGNSTVRLTFDYYTFGDSPEENVTPIDDNDFYNHTYKYANKKKGSVMFICKETMVNDNCELQFIKGTWTGI